MSSLFTSLIFICLLTYACSNAQKKPASTQPVRIVSLKNEQSKDKTGNVKPPKPVWGYRFVITGDFDGDDKKDTLTEHFVSRIDHKETNKFYENVDYDGMVESVIRKKPISVLMCNNKNISKLQFASKDNFGLTFLKNEGDLNGDGTDEISFVIDNADWSSLNSYTIMTFKGHKWQQLYSFPIWGWQLPPLPTTVSQYGLFGLDKKVNIKNDTLNRRIEHELKAFSGLVQKVANNKIRIKFRDDIDFTRGNKLVTLKHLNKRR